MTKLQWHPAFAAVLRIELEDEMKNLDIKDEYMLSKKPMQIDVLVVEKEKKEPLKKNIGRIDCNRQSVIERRKLLASESSERFKAGRRNQAVVEKL